ncbi:MAG: hypothetical protein LIO86_03680 [Lachnospiraceae bacterium]|nr:hypothetical protein [Lachnospiraceae bacterium]MCD8362663.1 hypothetical protein [Lachnospiraceae bacterium]
MDHWSQFVNTGDVREYLAYREQTDRKEETGEKNERRELYGNGNCVVRKTGGRL